MYRERNKQEKGETVDLISAWDELRALHLAVTDLRPDSQENLWTGLDWVGDYETAWPEWFLIRGLEVRDAAGILLHERLDERAPWAARRAPGTNVFDDVTEPTVRAREIARVSVWTPTASEFRREKVRLDQNLSKAKKEYTDGIRSIEPSTVTIRPGAERLATL